MLAVHPEADQVNQVLFWLDRNLEDERTWSAPANEDLLDFVRHDDGDLTVILGSRVETPVHRSVRPLRPLHLVRLRDGVQVQRWSLPLPKGSAVLSESTRVQLLAQGSHLAAVFLDDLPGALHIMGLAYDGAFRRVWDRTLQPKNDGVSEFRPGYDDFVWLFQMLAGRQIDLPGRRLSTPPAVMDAAGAVYALIDTVPYYAAWNMVGGTGGRRSIDCPKTPKQRLPFATLLHKVDARGTWQHVTCLNDAGVYGARLDGDTLHLLGGYRQTWHAGYATDGGTAQFRRDVDLKPGSFINLTVAPGLIAVGTTDREAGAQGGHTAGKQAAVYRLDTNTERRVQALYPQGHTNSRATLIEAVAGDRILIGGNIDGPMDEHQVLERTGFVSIYGANTF